MVHFDKTINLRHRDLQTARGVVQQGQVRTLLVIFQISTSPSACLESLALTKRAKHSSILTDFVELLVLVEDLVEGKRYGVMEVEEKLT